MKQIYYFIIILLCCICCTQDRVAEQPGGNGTITFQLAPIADEATRAPGVVELNENVIQNVQVFFYNETMQKCLFSPGSEDMQHHSETNTVTITIPSNLAVDILDHQIYIYAVVNYGITLEPEEKTLEQLQQTIYTNPTTFNPQSFTPRSSFLMDGKIGKVVIPSKGAANLPILYLQRAAAKITVKIDAAEVNGYQIQSAEVRLSNYLDKTVLGSDAGDYTAAKEEYMNSPFRPISIPESPVADEDPFYSYANDWEFNAVVESFITIAAYWQKSDGTDGRNYYYRIPFNYVPDDPEDGRKFCLRRNYIYEFNIDLNVLGGSSPEEAVELSPAFTIKSWTTHEVEIVINPYDYLIVEERDVEMHDITHYEIPYVSSTRVSIRIDSVFYHYYGKKGVVSRVDRVPGKFYPTIEAIHSVNTIHIDCGVPVNYVPTYIYFTVVAQSGLEQQVRVLLYPRQYVTAEWSPGPQGASAGSNHPEEDPNQNNYNFYTVTTTSLAPGDDFVLGDPTIRYKDPSNFYDNPIRVTKSDEISNRIVSPQFVIASQRGITRGDLVQSGAQNRCITYYETPDKYTLSMWRIPTTAELMLVAKLQRDPESAVKDLFYPANPNNYWWAARNDEESNGKWVYSVKVAQHTSDTDPEILRKQFHKDGASDDAPKNSVRCVYDIWRPYEKNGDDKDHEEVYEDN